MSQGFPGSLSLCIYIYSLGDVIKFQALNAIYMLITPQSTSIPPELSSKIQTPLTTGILHWVSHRYFQNGQNRTFDYLKLLFLPQPSSTKEKT